MLNANKEAGVYNFLNKNLTIQMILSKLHFS